MVGLEKNKSPYWFDNNFLVAKVNNIWFQKDGAPAHNNNKHKNTNQIHFLTSG